MSKILNLFERNIKILKYIFVVIIIICPILFDLEYLIYPFFYRNHLPIPSYVFSNFIIPLLALIILFLSYVRKRKLNKSLLIYTIVFFCFIYFHNKFVDNLYEILILTNNFSYNSTIENQYLIILFLPILLYFIFYELDIYLKLIFTILGLL